MSARIVYELGSPGFDWTGKPAVPSGATPAPLGDCRHCGYPAHGRDETGPIHLCCIRAEAAGVKCGACIESRKAAMRR